MTVKKQLIGHQVYEGAESGRGACLLQGFELGLLQISSHHSPSLGGPSPKQRAVGGPPLFSPQPFHNLLWPRIHVTRTREGVSGEWGGTTESRVQRGRLSSRWQGRGNRKTGGRGQRWAGDSGSKERKSRKRAGEAPDGLSLLKSLESFFLVIFGISGVFSYSRVSEEAVWSVSTGLADTLIIVRTGSLGRISRRITCHWGDWPQGFSVASAAPPAGRDGKVCGHLCHSLWEKRCPVPPPGWAESQEASVEGPPPPPPIQAVSPPWVGWFWQRPGASWAFGVSRT